MSTAYMKALGENRDVTTCECCGRTDLKKTIIMGIFNVDGNRESEMFYGITCASNASGRPVKDIESELKEVKRNKKLKEEKEAEENFIPSILANLDGAPSPCKFMFKKMDRSAVIHFLTESYLRSFIPSHLGKSKGLDFYCKMLFDNKENKGVWRKVHGIIYHRIDA